MGQDISMIFYRKDRKRGLLGLALAGLLWAWLPLGGSAALAQDAKLLMQCDQAIEGQTSTLSCDYRLSEAIAPEQVSLSVNGQDLDDVTFEPFRSQNNRAAWLFLIDRSNPKRAATVKRNLDLVSTLMRNSSAQRLMGVATFASTLDVVMPPAASHDNLEARLTAIKADGLATEYFSNALAAINVLKQTRAERRALVIMSDGKAEDTAYAREDVVKAAKEAGIIIIGIGFAERETETPFLQKVRRLAEETDGVFASVVGNQPLSSDFLTNLVDILENGGTVSAALSPDLHGPAKIELGVKSRQRQSYVASQNFELTEVKKPEPIAPPPPPKKDLIAKIFGALTPEFGDWAQDNQSLGWLLLALPLLLLVAAFVIFRKGAVSSSPLLHEDAEEGLEILPFPDSDLEEGLQEDHARTHNVEPVEMDVTYGFFEVVGTENTRYAINKKSMSIGRHLDNDLSLSNDSVHRHHAHFFITPDGEAVIKDLDTVNGVRVNHEPIASSVLKSGDMIELGDVRLRYVIT